MANTYEYQIFLNIQIVDDETAEPEFPALPEGFHVRLVRMPDTRQTRVWEGSLSIGHSRAELRKFAKWMREDLPKIFPGKISLYDPQMGRSLFMERDEEEWVDAVCKHDAWILTNLGGDSLHEQEFKVEMPMRTKLLLWFGVLLVALYFLTNFGLNLYFR